MIRSTASKLIFTAALLFPVPMMAFSTGPPIRRTGAPIDGGTSCVACHKTYAPENSDPRGKVMIAAAAYVPGVAQTLSVTIMHPDAKRWGFQLTARLASDPSKPAGTFATNAAVRVRCDSGTDTPCNGTTEFAEHVSAVVTEVGAGFTYTVVWTPPATAVGDIVFYAAGNAADGNGALTNDRIYTTSAIVSPATCNLSSLPVIGGVVSSAAWNGPVAPNSLISVFGSGFQPAGLTRVLYAADIAGNIVPSRLSCLAVEINKIRAPIFYASSGQLNVVVPSGVAAGPADVRVIANPAETSPVNSSPFTIQAAAAAPGVFTADGKRAAANFAGTNTLVGDPATVTGAKAAKPGDMVTLWATGLGDTNPHYDAAMIVPGAASTVNTVTVMLSGKPLPAANVLYAGMAPGLMAGAYQVNIQIPADAVAGDASVKLMVNGAASQDGVVLRLAAAQ